MTEGLLGRFKAVTHRFIERKLDKESFVSVIEVGAGNGEHKNYVTHYYEKYIQTDISQFGNFEIVEANAEKWKYCILV